MAETEKQPLDVKIDELRNAMPVLRKRVAALKAGDSHDYKSRDEPYRQIGIWIRDLTLCFKISASESATTTELFREFSEADIWPPGETGLELETVENILTLASNYLERLIVDRQQKANSRPAQKTTEKPRGRGRPPIRIELKRQAFDAPGSADYSNRQKAEILYATKHATVQQVKGVTAIENYYRKTPPTS